LLCTAKTAAGRLALSRWLLAPTPLPQVRRRQAAIDELRGRLDLREALELAGDELDAAIDPQALVRWGAAPPALSTAQARRYAAVAWGLPCVTAGALLAWLWGPVGPGALVVAVLATWGAGRVTARFVQRAHGMAERSARQLEVLARVLACLERERFGDPSLVELRAALVADQRSAARSIRGLARRLGWAEAARS